MAKVIMVQGTMSGVGKSLLTAGLLRVFVQEGYSCAPFKSQNMALNSYVTQDGLEMGRAQAMQAEAAGIQPSALMNPVLLKPTTDVGSQVIVKGRVIGNMKARDYFAYKKQLIPEILQAYRTLERQYDVIVIEGAGSPAEINLRENDIVNMGLAEMVDAPVLLVGDIDRGGVFAQLVGTHVLLQPAEQARIKAFVLNKFRGDVSLLTSGCRMLSERCHVPVAGVIPYLSLDLEDEDSLSERLTGAGSQAGSAQAPLIAVVHLPRISNFTDFNPLSMEGAEVLYTRKPEDLRSADCIILPGSKNTIADLRFIKKQGLAEVILQAAKDGKPVAGICGGYQMLGEIIEDPAGAEGNRQTKAGSGETEAGLGLLPCRTRLMGEKVMRQGEGTTGECSGIWSPLSDLQVQGYEIHMGETVRQNEKTAHQREEPMQQESVLQMRGSVWGTYYHGIFENDVFRARFLQCLGHAGGQAAAPQSAEYAAEHTKKSTPGRASYQMYKQMQYDRLAEAVRGSLDMELIYRILEESVKCRN